MLKYALAMILALLFVSAFAVGAELETVALRQGVVITNGTESRTLIEFDLSQFDGKEIEYAALSLQFVPAVDSCERYNVLICPLSTSWDEDVSWAGDFTRPGGDIVEGVGVMVPVARKRGYETRVLLTDIVRQWVNSDLSNYGLIIISDAPAADKGTLTSAQLRGSLSLEIHCSN